MFICSFAVEYSKIGMRLSRVARQGTRIVRRETESEWLRRMAIRAIAVGAIVGAATEAFMVGTGFYKVATRKEAERWDKKQNEIE